MSVRFDCSSATGINPAELLHSHSVLKEVQWEEGGSGSGSGSGSGEVQLSLTTRVRGRVRAVNDCNVEESGLAPAGVLRALTQLKSVELYLPEKDSVPHKGDEDDDDSLVLSTDEHGAPISHASTSTSPALPLPQTTRMVFMEVADGPLGLDLRAATICHSSSSASAACGGLQVAAVFSRGEFAVGDIITACNGVAVTGLTLQNAIAVLVQAVSRKVVVVRHSFTLTPPTTTTVPSHHPATQSSTTDATTAARSSPHNCNTSIRRNDHNMTRGHDCGTALHLHWLWRGSPYPSFTIQNNISAYSMYLCSSRKRAADRASFDYIPGID